MTEDEALAALPETYAEALRLQAGGASPAQIAEALAVPDHAVASLLSLARAKLGRLLAQDGAPTTERP